MATGTIKAEMKYVDTALLTFNVSNYLGLVNVASVLGIDKSRIISIMVISSAGFGTSTPTFTYELSTGNIACYTSAVSATIKAVFRVIYI